MSSVGETLRRERLRKDLGLEQISRETKISARLLEAIENDQFDLLPGGVFAKSFVRQYARFLGLDEEEMAAEVEKAVNPVGDLPNFAGAPEPAFKVPPVAEWEGAGRSSSSVLPALALVVAVILVCSGFYAWWQRSRRPAPVTPPPAAAQKAPATPPKPAERPPITPAVANNPEAPNTGVSASAQAQEGAPPQEAPAPPPAASANPAAPLQVSLTADADPAWVRVWADGKIVVDGVLQPNEVKTAAAMEGIRIRTGNAGSLQVTVNGKPVGPLGPKGQVRVVEVTREGVHILLPPPKPALAPAPEPL